MLKKLLTVVTLFFIVSYCLESRIITVSNNPSIPAQFANLQTAIDSASAGDTIYVHKSLTSYGDINFDKEIHLVGSGYHTRGESYYQSRIRNICMKTGSSNCSFVGFHIYSINNCTYNNTSNNIIISKCYISSTLTINGSGWILFNNVIKTVGYGTSFNINNYSNILIYNNIFDKGSNGTPIMASNQSSVRIFNNIFYGNLHAFNGINNATIENNIFYNSSPDYCSNCTFNNNITYNTSQNDLPYGNNFGENNFSNQDPLFDFNILLAVYFPYDYNFHFQSESLCKIGRAHV